MILSFLFGFSLFSLFSSFLPLSIPSFFFPWVPPFFPPFNQIVLQEESMECQRVLENTDVPPHKCLSLSLSFLLFLFLLTIILPPTHLVTKNEPIDLNATWLFQHLDEENKVSISIFFFFLQFQISFRFISFHSHLVNFLNFMKPINPGVLLCG